jgi:hypothetical protein
MCFSCKDETSFPLNLNQIELLRKIVRIKKLKEGETLMQGQSAVERSFLARLIEEFFLFHLDWEPRSLRILKEGL